MKTSAATEGRRINWGEAVHKRGEKPRAGLATAVEVGWQLHVCSEAVHDATRLVGSKINA